MAYRIIESCVNCWACAPLCPSGAIYADEPHFRIAPEKCAECQGDYAHPQCASICPIEGAIVDGAEETVNPPGSLTGVSPDHQAAAIAEIRAR